MDRKRRKCAKLPDELVPEPPLSRIIEFEDPLVPEEVEVPVEPDEVEPLEVPVEVEPLEVPDEVEPLEVPEEVEEPAGVNLTASALVVAELVLDSMTTFACPEKL